MHKLGHWIVLGVLVLCCASYANSAAAQGAISTGCAAVNAGSFDQTVAPNTNGTTRGGTFAFASGDTLRVGIQNARNSLFDIGGVTTIFSGETGTQTKTYAFTAAVASAFVSADIRANAAGPGTITASCISGSAGSSTGTTSSTASVTMSVDAALDGVDRVRPVTAPTALPSVQPRVAIRLRRQFVAKQNELNQTVKQRAELEERNIGLLIDLGIRSPQLRGSLELIEAQYFSIVSAQRSLDAGDAALVRVEQALERMVAGLPDAQRTEASATAAEQLGIIKRYIQRLKNIAVHNAHIVALEEELSVIRFELTGESNRLVDASIGTSGQLRLSTQGSAFGAGRSMYWLQSELGQLRGASDRDGQSASLRLGMAHDLGSGVVMGYYLSYLNVETSISGPNTKVDSDGLGAGLYLTFDLSERVTGGISVFHENADVTAEVNGASGSFQRRYSSVEAEISSVHFSGLWTITPSLGFGRVVTDRDGYTDSASNVIPGARESFTTASLQVGFDRALIIDFAQADSVNLTGHLGLNYQDRERRVLSTNTTLENGDLSGSFGLGARIEGRDGGVLQIDLGARGLGTDTTTLSLGGRYELEF